MKILRSFFLFLCLVSTSFGFAENSIPRTNKTFVSETKIQNGFPNIFRPIVNIFKKILGIKPKLIIEDGAFVSDLSLSRSEVTLSCPTIQPSCSTDTRIKVFTLAVDPENDVLIYVYKVSGGKIVGTGANVVWDLSGVPIGTYTITAGVDDSCGVCGQTQTKTVKVVECPDCK